MEKWVKERGRSNEEKIAVGNMLGSSDPFSWPRGLGWGNASKHILSHRSATPFLSLFRSLRNGGENGVAAVPSSSFLSLFPLSRFLRVEENERERERERRGTKEEQPNALSQGPLFYLAIAIFWANYFKPKIFSGPNKRTGRALGRDPLFYGTIIILG